MAILTNRRGRPSLNKIKHRLSFSRLASKVGKQRAFALGIDLSDYIEHLVRNDNPQHFGGVVLFGGNKSISHPSK